jgi:hypothetical protein
MHTRQSYVPASFLKTLVQLTMQSFMQTHQQTTHKKHKANAVLSCCCCADLLPLFPGASEFDALQAAATSSSSQLHTRAER